MKLTPVVKGRRVPTAVTGGYISRVVTDDGIYVEVNVGSEDHGFFIARHEIVDCLERLDEVKVTLASLRGRTFLKGQVR